MGYRKISSLLVVSHFWLRQMVIFTWLIQSCWQVVYITRVVATTSSLKTGKNPNGFFFSWQRNETKTELSFHLVYSYSKKLTDGQGQSPGSRRVLEQDRNIYSSRVLQGKTETFAGVGVLEQDTFAVLLPRMRFEPWPLGNLCTESKGLDHWTTSGVLYFWDRDRAFLHK